MKRVVEAGTGQEPRITRRGGGVGRSDLPAVRVTFYFPGDPVAPGCPTVAPHLTIRPQLGPLEQAAGTLPHPRGEVTVSLENRRGRLRGRIALPPGVTATVHVNGRKQTLSEGSSEIHS